VSDDGRIIKKAGRHFRGRLPEADRTSRTTNFNRDPLLDQRSIVQEHIKQKQADLPHLYGWKWYQWAWNFYESRNRMNLLTAGNQCSKSSTMIRKNIEWACNRRLWPKLWRRPPKMFWYFYPSLEVATIEFEKKWVPEFMPKGNMKHHEWYGWEAEYSGGELQGIHFKSGVTLYFKTYGQRQINLQTASVDMASTDEELPEPYVDEILARLAATEGYFNAVFTATIGQQLWYRAMECIGTPDETFKSAMKQTVSLYDCQVYMDGTPGFWTLERIKEREGMCSSQAEIQKRIHGRFVKDGGRKYQSFNPERLHLDPEPVPSTWRYYAGVDIGSGGGPTRSAGAICVLAVNAEMTKGRVVKTWRGDYEETTAADILRKYREMVKGLPITQACYDYQSREFGLVAARSGESFVQADKARDSGDQIVNTLFAAGALTLDRAYESQKLIVELMSLPDGPKKSRSYRDDLCDALRYAAKLVPWDFAAIAPNSGLGEPAEGDKDDYRPMTAKEYEAWEIRQRRGEMETPKDDLDEFYQEIEEWNRAYGN